LFGFNTYFFYDFILSHKYLLKFIESNLYANDRELKKIDGFCAAIIRYGEKYPCDIKCFKGLRYFKKKNFIPGNISRHTGINRGKMNRWGEIPRLD